MPLRVIGSTGFKVKSLGFRVWTGEAPQLIIGPVAGNIGTLFWQREKPCWGRALRVQVPNK